MVDTQFYPLTVSKVQQETPEAVTISFDVPANLSETFSYIQGQYLTLRFTLQGKEQRRAYSMSSSPVEPGLAITVKKVHKGVVSTHLCEKIRPGDTIEVMPPQGRFHTPIDADQRKTYYLFAAGSGITPLMSILKTILEQEPQSVAYLLYGSRHDDEIIFFDQLQALQQRYAGQLETTFICSQPRKQKGGWFSKAQTNWAGAVGRINALEIDRFLNKHPLRKGDAEYFVCGPGNMIDAVVDSLKVHGVPEKHVHTERFVNAGEAAAVPAASASGGQASVTLRGKTVQVQVSEKQTILKAMLDAGHDAPYSCLSGACSTCMAKLESGTVSMDACYALDDDEVAKGYILCCQARPTSPEVVVNFDV